ncbi:hypothetical protein E2C01_063749 [Portunus trituberculatus]|uniref:Uncharacterized protein n=1 Tax=Portunus trituberculatus TaxID=210409 RepID=A0A5B7HH81_PORTR|nr:hypothetical protein [Portunus trituberculatus]
MVGAVSVVEMSGGDVAVGCGRGGGGSSGGGCLIHGLGGNGDDPIDCDSCNINHDKASVKLMAARRYHKQHRANTPLRQGFIKGLTLPASHINP